MKYREYKSGSYWFYIGLVLFFFFGGLRFLVQLLPGLFYLFFQLLPLLIVVYLATLIWRSYRLSHHTGERGPSHTQFVELLIYCMIHVVKADGRVDPREIAVIRQFFQVNMGFVGIQMAWVDDLINRHLRSPLAFEVVMEELNRNFNYDSKLILLQLLYRIAYSDNDFSSSEKDIIAEIVAALSIKAEDDNRIKQFVSPGQSASKNWDILGVKPGASKEEIKAAYRQLIKENHPDKVHHLGEEFQKVAQRRMAEINAAYNELLKEVS